MMMPSRARAPSSISSPSRPMTRSFLATLSSPPATSTRSSAPTLLLSSPRARPNKRARTIKAKTSITKKQKTTTSAIPPPDPDPAATDRDRDRDGETKTNTATATATATGTITAARVVTDPTLKRKTEEKADPLAALHNITLDVCGTSRSHRLALVRLDFWDGTSFDHLDTILQRYHHDPKTSYLSYYPIKPIPKARTLRIIHNTHLLKQYQRAQQIMTTRGIQFTERIMFHGTDDEAREAICEEGFDHECSRVAGIWLAESCIAISHQTSDYISGSTSNYLLACRVLVPHVQLHHNSDDEDDSDDEDAFEEAEQRLLPSERMKYARLNENVNDPIIILSNTCCILPCAIIGF